MSFNIEQKINGRIYLYKVESYWDKEKKQSRQRRVYLGPKDKKPGKNLKAQIRNIISKNLGNIELFNTIVDNIGLKDILIAVFPADYEEILALSYYDIMNADPSYLFPYWLEEQYLPNVKKMYSTHISSLYDHIGGMQKQRLDFMEKWIDKLKPIQGIYYDITSVSSYSTKVDFIEWGYNRDGDNLPQLNLGLVSCQKNSLPFFYSIFPGSIVDVTTLKNKIKYLKSFDLKDILLILDRGFFSTTNVSEMNKSENRISFIQPLSFSLKKAKELIKSHNKALHSSSTVFKFQDEILHYVQTTINIGEEIYDAHVFLNEQAAVEQKNNFISKLIEIEEKLQDTKFITHEDCENYYNDNIPENYERYYKCNKTSLKIERNIKNCNSYLSSIGYFILISNIKGLDKSYVLNCYRERDSIEKIFDIFKNEIDGNRIRVHSQWSVEGKFFLKFITLIIYMRIARIMRDHKLFDKYSIKEMIRELKKIKLTIVNSEEQIISEVTKKQRTLLEVFNVKLKHSY